MQPRSTFPELNAGLKKSRPAPKKGVGGFTGFKVGGKVKSRTAEPSSFAARRALSRKSASGG